jgi:hypothetical protein
MPVQINEVIIRAVVNGNSAAESVNAPVNTPANSSAMEDEIAAMVLEIIKEKNER